MAVSTSLRVPLSPSATTWTRSSFVYGVLITIFSILGMFSILRPVLQIWSVWTTDPLRSIGMFFPFISAALILWKAKEMRWNLSGSWWGLLPLILAILMGHLLESMMLFFEIGHALQPLPQSGPIVFGYACGIVLLFGGTELFRRSLFPLALLLCVNPVPHFFNSFVDVPLQYISAHIARSFAMSLGQPLTPDQLRLMFTPDFGIYIAPGCNGIRGSITMGYFALITGYLCRFPLRLHAMVVAGAVLLGYVFNFLRLCLLVIFYVIALHVPALQDHGKGVDYLIGSCLFTIAAVLLSLVVLRVSKRVVPRDPAKGIVIDSDISSGSAKAAQTGAFQNVYTKLAVFVFILLLGSASYARTWKRGARMQTSVTSPFINLSELYPVHLGDFTLVRSWKEGDDGAIEDYDWADYRMASKGELITIGISPLKGAHDANMCHLARGEKPVWRGSTHLMTSDGQDVAFSTFFYSDGVTQFIEASTLCGPTHCGETSTLSSPFKMLYSAPLPESLVDEALGRPVPVLIKAEIGDQVVPQDLAKQMLLERLRYFVSGTSLASLSGKYFSH